MHSMRAGTTPPALPEAKQTKTLATMTEAIDQARDLLVRNGFVVMTGGAYDRLLERLAHGEHED